jgi:diacylglycerol kinase (ATP)
MQKIAMAVNPKAGNGLSVKLVKQLSALLTVKQLSHKIFSEKWPVTFEGFTDVWIIGGDGTLNYFINHYPSIRLPLVIFKGGTGNDFAWKLYGNCSVEEQFDLVLKAEPKPIDAASCNNALYINGVGIGFDGEVLESMKAIRIIGGHIGYYLVVLKKILTFRESGFKIFSKNLLADEKFLLVMLNNSSRTGGGFHVSPKASVNDGLLDLVLVKPLNIVKRFLYLPRIEKGKHLHLPFVSHITGTEFTVECEHQLSAQLDGELIKGRRFSFLLLKDQFLFRY